ncbi:sensor histidine kinase [Paenibacillus ihuae]|uniref:sensor histidine kinase n=1 Tax=Paenibacillus ihuae TaxID=1232431 RepID=UPI00131C58F8|nr:GHKL domain-containing protein [Paenibacillus ihuae]
MGSILYTLSNSLILPIIVHACLTVSGTLLFAVVYRDGAARIMYYSFRYVSLVAITHIGSSCLFFLLIKFTPLNVFKDESQLIIILLSLLFLFLLITFSSSTKKEITPGLSKLQCFAFILILISNIFITAYLFINNKHNTPYLLAAMAISCTCLFIIYYFELAAKATKLSKINNQLNEQFVAQDNNLKHMSNTFKSIQSVIHDINKQLIYIEKCIVEDLPQDAVIHINQILRKVHHSYHLVNTGNIIIDALVGYTLNTANQKRIEVTHQIHAVPNNISIERYDLCILMGNILDNAIEAVEGIGQKPKWIEINIHSKKNFLIIQVINPYEVDHAESDSGRYDCKTRGYGLDNIRNVTDKYGGSMSVLKNESTFDIIAVLPFSKIA